MLFTAAHQSGTPQYLSRSTTSDMIVATVVLARERTAMVERGVMEFLNGRRSLHRCSRHLQQRHVYLLMGAAGGRK